MRDSRQRRAQQTEWPLTKGTGIPDHAHTSASGGGDYAWADFVAADVTYLQALVADILQGNLVDKSAAESISALWTFARIAIGIVDATHNGLIITGAASQTADLIQAFNNAATKLFYVWNTGHMSNFDGWNSAAAQYGTGILLHNYGESVPEHTNGIGSYDHTGGTSEQLFTKTTGDDFTQADEDNGNWIALLGVNLGATAEIKEFIDANNVVVDGMMWATDFASQSFYIFKHPVFVVGDGDDTEISTGAAGKFEVFSYAYTASKMANFKNTVAADDSTTLEVEVVGNGYNGGNGLRVAYETGDIQPLDLIDTMHITIDETGADSADATTHIHAIAIEKTNSKTVHTDAVHVGPGFTEAFHVVGTPAIDPGYGYEVTVTTVVDRVNSGGAGDDAFVNAAVNQQLFDTFNDYILIGSDNTFEIIAVDFATPGNKDSNFEFYFSIAGAGFAGWTQFFPEDTTNGGQNSGSITFLAPALWAKDDQAEVNGDITDAYYIGIKRKKVGSYTFPTESFFKTFANQEGGMNIRGDGVVTLPYLGAAPASLANGMVWMESDGLHIYYAGAEKLVAGV